MLFVKSTPRPAKTLLKCPTNTRRAVSFYFLSAANIAAQDKSFAGIKRGAFSKAPLLQIISRCFFNKIGDMLFRVDVVADDDLLDVLF